MQLRMKQICSGCCDCITPHRRNTETPYCYHGCRLLYPAMRNTVVGAGRSQRLSLRFKSYRADYLEYYSSRALWLSFGISSLLSTVAAIAKASSIAASYRM